MKKTIVMTGANRGIGLALVRTFAEQGWQVEACCRNPGQATDLQDLVRGNRQVRLHRLDVTEAAHVRDLQMALENQPVDILFNNAGLFGPRQQGFGQTDPIQWLEVFRVNVIAAHKLTEALVDNLATSTHRLVANMGSLLGSIDHNRSGGRYLYRTAKAAVAMLTKCQSCDLRERGIIAVVLHPGWVRTEMGGPEAPLTPRDSARQLCSVLTGLSMTDTGRFFNYDGTQLPW